MTSIDLESGMRGDFLADRHQGMLVPFDQQYHIRHGNPRGDGSVCKVSGAPPS